MTYRPMFLRVNEVDVLAKPCSKCKRIKVLTEFGVLSKVKSGRRSECFNCGAGTTAQYRLANLEQVREKSRVYMRGARERWPDRYGHELAPVTLDTIRYWIDRGYLPESEFALYAEDLRLQQG